VKDIPAGLLEEITKRLVAEFDPEQIILFGSHAWGTPTDDSDLDLLVIVTNSAEPEIERMVRVQKVLGDLIVPADVLVKTRTEADFFREVHASLVCEILERGKALYERREEPSRSELAHQSVA